MTYEELAARAEKQIRIVRGMALGKTEVDGLCSTVQKLISHPGRPEKGPEKKEEKKKDRSGGGSTEPGA